MILPIAAIIAGMAYLAISSWGANTAMQIPRVPIGQSPASVGLEYEDVSFPSRADSITLEGWYIPGGAFCVIIVNGGHQNRVDPGVGTLELSLDLFKAGYSILLFDLRGRGESEGKGIVLTHCGQDIGGAIDYIKARGFSGENIGIIGFSTGAASAIIFASKENIAALVADSCFPDVSDSFVKQVVKERGIDKHIVSFFTPGVFLMARLMYGYKEIDPVDRVADISCPILFIQGEADDLVSTEDADRLLEASGNPLDRIWIVPQAEHCRAYKTDPVSYMSKVKDIME